MAQFETPLEMARRHVASQEALIDRQFAIIRRLGQAGQPTELATSMLKTVQRTLQLYRQDLQRISRMS